MRIRFFRAWASNNSGAYVLLGRFRDAAVAAEVGRTLDEALAAHDLWARALPPSTGESPFMAFARAHGLPMQEGWVSWNDGMRCEVLDTQVLLEGYAAEMPSAFVAFVAKHGGHVASEIIHAHGAVMVRANVWMKNGYRPEREDDARAARARFETAIETDAELADALASDPRWPRPTRRAHVLDLDGFDHSVEVLVAPRDVAKASRALRRCAAAEGLTTLFHVFEWSDDEGDPAETMLLAMRTESLGVEIDDVGATPAELERALVELVGLGPDQAKQLLAPDRRGPRRFFGAASRRECDVAARVVRRFGASAHVRSQRGPVEESG
jgi:hypothetical protein